jgi:hypothetical protein
MHTTHTSTHTHTHTHAVHSCIYATIDVAITRMHRTRFTFVMLCWKASSTSTSSSGERAWLVGWFELCALWAKPIQQDSQRVNQSHSIKNKTLIVRKVQCFTRGKRVTLSTPGCGCDCHGQASPTCALAEAPLSYVVYSVVK